MKKVKVLVLRTAGTNCNEETAFAFRYFGAKVDQVHINLLRSKEYDLKNYHILALPGGFSYGDDIASGRILANELRFHLIKDIKQFIKDGKLIIGICNGFQILVKSGILPGFDSHVNQHQTMTLTTNDSAKFEDRWTHLKVSGQSAWTKNLDTVVYYPVAHAEGKFLVSKEEILKLLQANGQIAFRYCSAIGGKPKYPQNPNGSLDDVAGITDSTGRVLGLMPHPERHFFFEQHPYWTRLDKKAKLGAGAKIFENGVEYIKGNF